MRLLRPMIILLLFFELAPATNTLVNAQATIPGATPQKSIALPEALRKITRVFGTRFVYDRDALKGKTTLYRLDNLRGAQLEDVLKAVLYPNDLVFLYVKANYYTIVPRGQVGVPGAPGVPAPAVSGSGNDIREASFAEREKRAEAVRDKGTIRGQVTDPEGKGIAAVNIMAKGSKTVVVVSDADGYYTIDLPSEAHQLLFTSIGYENQSLPVAGSAVLNVSMKVSVGALAEVVVVGYGEQKKATLTGAVSSIKGKELEQSPGANISQLLGGRLPGLIASNKSGLPGADDATLLIRGLSTTGDNTPLIVIDGVVRTSFSFIDPNDVASISLLKDASAVAVYGARAANGVILVTTKRGIAGKTAITFTGNVGRQHGIRLIPTLDSYTTALLWNEAWKNEGVFAPTSGGLKGYDDATLAIIKSQSNPDRYSNTDWYKAIVGTGATQTGYNLSINGGGSKSRYFVSGGYLDQQGFYPAADFKRYNIRANLDATLADDLDFSLNISGRIEDRRNAPGTPVKNGLMTPRIEPIQYANGTYHYDVPWVGNAYLVAQGYAGYTRATNNILENSMSLNYKLPFVQGLSVKGFVAFDKTFTFGKNFTRPYLSYLLNDDNSFTAKPVPASGLAQLSESYAQTQSLTAEASLNYNRVIDRHSITALLLYTQTQNSGDALSAARINFPSPALDQLVVGSTVGATNSGTGTQVARKGVVGKLGYSYNDRYLFDFSFRYDGSDVFPPGQRYGFFPALSAGWRISEEKFFRGLMPYVDNLKLRASYGKAGNDRVGQFQYLSTYSIGNGASFGGASATATPVLIPGTIANGNFTWEKAIIRDIGLEATLWKGLLSVEADYYYKRTKDILAPNTAIPAVIGGTLPSQNIATVDNRGFEILLGHQNRIGRVKYNISANATFFKSKVISYPDPAGTLDALKLTGKPVGPDAVTGYKANGLYQSAAEVTGGPTPLYPNVAAGDIRYMDMNKSGAIDANDRVIISRGITPGMMYGFSAGAGYAGFDLTAFFQGATDTRVYIPNLINNSFYAGYQNLYPYQTDRWTPSNPNASFPRLTVTSKNNQAVSSYWVRNADYLRLKSVEIGYTVPERIARHIRSAGIRFYVNGSNLFTVSKLKIVDPELGNDGNANSYPLVQIFNAGASIKF